MVTKKRPEDTKLLVLSGNLIDKVKKVSTKHGVSIASFVSDVLKDVLRADELGTTITEGVDAYRLMGLMKEAGVMMVPRSILSQIISNMNVEELDELKRLWSEAGHWYGVYLSSKMNSNNIYPILEKELTSSWTLDEVEIRGGDDAQFKFTCFRMSEEFTELLLSYVCGLMDALGYREIERDQLRGMATVRFATAPR